MLGMERHGIQIRDPALVSEGATMRKWDAQIGTMGSSYVSSYRPGDWQGVYSEAKNESQQWASQVQELANVIHTKKIQLDDIKNQLEISKIKHKAKAIARLEGELAQCKAEFLDLKTAEKNLNKYHQALGDLRAAEDHRKPRSQPSSPYASPAMQPIVDTISKDSPLLKPPSSPVLDAVKDPRFEGSKRLLPG